MAMRTKFTPATLALDSSDRKSSTHSVAAKVSLAFGAPPHDALFTSPPHSGIGATSSAMAFMMTAWPADASRERIADAVRSGCAQWEVG